MDFNHLSDWQEPHYSFSYYLLTLHKKGEYYKRKVVGVKSLRVWLPISNKSASIPVLSKARAEAPLT